MRKVITGLVALLFGACTCPDDPADGFTYVSSGKYQALLTDKDINTSFRWDRGEVDTYVITNVVVTPNANKTESALTDTVSFLLTGSGNSMPVDARARTCIEVRNGFVLGYGHDCAPSIEAYNPKSATPVRPAVLIVHLPNRLDSRMDNTIGGIAMFVHPGYEHCTP